MHIPCGLGPFACTRWRPSRPERLPIANAPKNGKSGSMKCGAAILLAFAVAAETDDAHCGYAADAWRITPAEQTGNMGDSWTVRELHVYEDSDCEGDPIQVTSVFSKPSKPDRSDIVDGDTGSWWQANCGRTGDGCAAYGPHVGFYTATNTTARCVKLYQCSGTGCAPSIALQYMINGGDWTTAIIFDAKHGAFEDYPIHFPCPTTPPTLGPESSPSGSSDANAASAGLITGVVVGAAVVLLVLLAGYFILKNRHAAPLPMKASDYSADELRPAKPPREGAAAAV